MRQTIADRYLFGEGIEIGALHNPLKVQSNVKVKYVDRLDIKDLRNQYPELNDLDLINIDIIDDGETLEIIEDNSQDFIIANHFIEHCQDPIKTIKNFLRVLKSNGIVYLAIPDKRFTFDKHRQLTTIEHLFKDYNEGSNTSKLYHFTEWSKLVDEIPDEERTGHVKMLLKKDYSIHFHVWEYSTFAEFITYCIDKLYFPFQVELAYMNNSEFIFILKKL